MERRKILYVLLEEWADFEWSFISTALHFYKDKFENITVGISKDVVNSIGGLKVVPDYDLTEASNLDFDTLILIGGNKWKETKCQQLDDFVKKCAAAGKTVAAICNASSYLASIGLLNDVDHTTNNLEETKQWAQSSYTNESSYKQQQCVTSKNIITANGSASLEFARDVMLKLGDIPEEGIMWWYNFNKNGLWQK